MTQQTQTSQTGTPQVVLDHLLDADDARFAELATAHPDRVTPVGDWTPEGESE